MAFSSKIKTLYQIRSISLPCRSHPSTDKIEVELNKLKSFDTLSSSCGSNAIVIIDGLSQLEGLYRCLGDFLSLGITQQALSHRYQCEIHIVDLQEKFMSLLEICSTAKDFVSHMKENFRDIQSSLRRRRKGDQSNIDGVVAKYNLYMKKMKKDATKLVATFKQIDIGFTAILISELNDHVSSIIRVLREVVATTTSIFQSVILLFCSLLSKPKTRWSMVSKMLHKESVICENQIGELNELHILDNALDQLSKSASNELGEDQMMKVAQDRVNSLVVEIEEIENGTECLYRGLIKTRAYLLNIGSSMM